MTVTKMKKKAVIAQIKITPQGFIFITVLVNSKTKLPQTKNGCCGCN